MVEMCRAWGIEASLAQDYVLKRLRLDWVQISIIRTLLIDIVATFSCLMSWRYHARFYLFVISTISNLPTAVGSFERLNITRNTLKKIGIYEFIRRRSSEEQIILVDEGTIHSAHNLFVHTSSEPSRDNLSNFVRLVPLPDASIYVQQDEGILVDRTLKRGHKRISNGSCENTKLFIRRAINTFDALKQETAINRNMLVIDAHQTVTIPAWGCHGPVATALKILSSVCNAAITEK